MQQKGFVYKRTNRSISSVSNLCHALDITIDDLHAAQSLSEEQRYRSSDTAKSDGSIRTVYNPHHLIRLIQRRINRRFFSNANFIAWPDFIFGSIPNVMEQDGRTSHRDYIACAQVHCLSKSVLKLDIKNFFDNISSELVFDIFHRLLKFPEEVSSALTDICTHEGKLIQGALTSSYLARADAGSECNTVIELKREPHAA